MGSRTVKKMGDLSCFFCNIASLVALDIFSSSFLTRYWSLYS